MQDTQHTMNQYAIQPSTELPPWDYSHYQMNRPQNTPVLHGWVTLDGHVSFIVLQLTHMILQ